MKRVTLIRPDPRSSVLSAGMPQRASPGSGTSGHAVGEPTTAGQHDSVPLPLPIEVGGINDPPQRNTTAATIPLLLAEATRNGKLKPGMKVAMVAFGAGFTWGCAIVDW